MGEFKRPRDYEIVWRRIYDQKNDWANGEAAIGARDPGWRVKLVSMPCLQGYDCHDHAIDSVRFVNCLPGDVPDNADQVRVTGSHATASLVRDESA